MSFLNSLFAPNVKKFEKNHDVDGLIRALSYQKDNNIRRMAAEALGRLGDPQAVEPLITMLQDDDKFMRYTVVEALGKLGDPRAVEPLIATLNEDDKNLRYTVVESLKALDDPRAVEPLVALLHEDDKFMRRPVVEALEQLNWQPGSDELAAIYHVTRQNWQQCVELGPAAFSPLLEVVTDPAEPGVVRQAAAEALASLGDPRAVEQLILHLDEHMIEPLLQMGEPAAIVFIMDKLKSLNYRVPSVEKIVVDIENLMRTKIEEMSTDDLMQLSGIHEFEVMRNQLESTDMVSTLAQEDAVYVRKTVAIPTAIGQLAQQELARRE